MLCSSLACTAFFSFAESLPSCNILLLSIRCPAVEHEVLLVQVLLVSAQEALLSRLMLRQDPQPAATVVQRFKERAFGSSRAVQRRQFGAAELRDAAQDMLEDSGECAVQP
jgi:hypothetical protein